MMTFNFKGQNFVIKDKILSGMTADVYRTDCGKIIKKIKKITPLTRDIFERELFWLNQLSDSNIVPKTLAVDRDNCVILMEDCGHPLERSNAPVDWKDQLVQILEVLKLHNCRHNDLQEKELLVKDGKISVVDFGYASLGSDMTCGGRFDDVHKNRLFDDKYIINLFGFLLNGPTKGSEIHTFVLWDGSEYGYVEKHIAKEFTIIQSIAYSPQSINYFGADRLDFLSRFYHGRVSKHGQKAKTTFTLFVVIDFKPKYEERTNVFNGDVNVVNINTFDLLQVLRNGRTSFLHGSDNIQEAYDNLEILTLYKGAAPLKYWQCWRPQFETFGDFFHFLNEESELAYVLLRNYDHLLEENSLEKGDDIDLLVNDFHLFKRISGALGYKHKGPDSNRNKGPAYEYGGYKFAGKVLIGKEDISVDIRVVGDNYYDTDWEKDILDNRIAYRGSYVPNQKDYFYSLLYHALVHKRSFPAKYLPILEKGARILGVIDDKESLTNDKAWSILDAYMSESGYKYRRPRELSILFNARKRAGITATKDILSSKEYLRKGQHYHARHLLRQLIYDHPFNLTARFLQLRIESLFLMEKLLRTNLRLFMFRIKSYIRKKLRK